MELSALEWRIELEGDEEPAERRLWRHDVMVEMERPDQQGLALLEADHFVIHENIAGAAQIRDQDMPVMMVERLVVRHEIPPACSLKAEHVAGNCRPGWRFQA